MRRRSTSRIDALANVPNSRMLVALLLTTAALYMAWQAHADGVAIAKTSGFGSDFHGTIWAADRAVLHGISPYRNPSRLVAVPAVYLPPIFLTTLPLGWLSLHVAMWIWFGCLVASAFSILFILGVREPWCYALFAMSLPIEQALVLGNASILVALGAALGWRFRRHPLLGPLAVAAAVTVKFWARPLIIWLLIIRPRAGVRAALIFGVLTFGAWAIIGFQGFLDYPDLIHAEGGRFASAGSLFIPALVQLHLTVRIATALGILASLALLGLAWMRRSSDIESFSLALLASLVATTVAWPHHLVLMALPIAILYPRLALAWAWFPALWVAAHVGQSPGQFGYSLPFCVFAALPVAIVFAARRKAPIAVTHGIV
jgi:Glycosyltransferase family 87